MVEFHADGGGAQSAGHGDYCNNRPLQAENHSRCESCSQHRNTDLNRTAEKCITPQVFQLAKGELHSEHKQEEHDSDLRHRSHGLPCLLTCHRLEKAGICDSESAQEIGDEQGLAQLE